MKQLEKTGCWRFLWHFFKKNIFAANWVEAPKVIQGKAEGLGNKADEDDEDGVFASEEQRLLV